MASNGNGDKKWESRRKVVLFYGGLFGIFLYLFLVAVGTVFHVEFLLGFLTMMGLGITQGVDKG